LTFTPQEFETLTHEVAECYCVQMPIGEGGEVGCKDEKLFDVSGP
jgi:hypothetical protein